MIRNNYYDVTKWEIGNVYEDIGEVINSIIADIKENQTNIDVDNCGKPGAIIYIPPGDYQLLTQVVIDISFLKIVGSGHGFTSSSIRFNVPENKWPDLHELWPGGSRVFNNIEVNKDSLEIEGAAFVVKREGEPRISSVEFQNFCIDGLHFVDDEGTEPNPENTYINYKTGIYVASAQDSFRISEMGIVYLEHGVTLYNSDALAVHDNFIAECGNCLELRGWGQASKITDNLMGAGFNGYSIYAEKFAQVLISSNNIFPRGKSIVHLNGVTRSMVSNNVLHSFYPGMVILENGASENMISSNHFLRDIEPWKPMQHHNNGLDDLFGLLSIDGNYNSVIGNHFSEVVDLEYVIPTNAIPVIINIKGGNDNYISNNHIVTSQTTVDSGDSAYDAQVETLLQTDRQKPLDVLKVRINNESRNNTVLDSGSVDEVELDASVNAFRATPTIMKK